jgi:hypothetical protein
MEQEIDVGQGEVKWRLGLEVEGWGGKWRVVEGSFSRSFKKITQHIPSILSIPSIPSTLSKEE